MADNDLINLEFNSNKKHTFSFVYDFNVIAFRKDVFYAVVLPFRIIKLNFWLKVLKLNVYLYNKIFYKFVKVV